MESLKRLLQPRGGAAASEHRLILVNQDLASKHPHKHFKNNYVSTTKYNVATYLPKALYEQFRCALPAYCYSVWT